MAIDLDTNPGGFFRIVGRIAFVVNSINSFRGDADLSAASIASIGVGTTNILGQFASANQQLVDSMYAKRDRARSTLSGYASELSQLASSTLVEMANDDTPLSSLTLSAAMTLLISQMRSATETVNANAVSVSVATGSSNVGTAVCISSIKGPDGKDREYVIPEVIRLRAITDSQSSSITAGSESWSLTSPVAQTDQLSWDWPKGSASSATISASTDSSSKLVNGDFEDWTGNVPDYWTVVVGVGGTDILKSTTTLSSASTYSLRILGDGSTLSAIRQKFNDGDLGTSYRLLPSTVYAIHCWLRVSTVPSAGVLKITLTDSAGTALTNDASATCEISKTLSGATTSFASFGGYIQTPSLMNSTAYYLKVHLSTALDNTKSVYVDDLRLVTPTEVYRGGPYLAVFAGATATVKEDTFAITVANDWAGKLQKACQQFFNMRQLGMAIPSNSVGSETVSDSLVA
jgi:hypothetical protein